MCAPGNAASDRERETRQPPWEGPSSLAPGLSLHEMAKDWLFLSHWTGRTSQKRCATAVSGRGAEEGARPERRTPGYSRLGGLC